MAAIYVVLGAIAYIAFMVVAGMLWRAYVGTKLWLWFVVPQFGLTPLPIPIAIGLSTLIGLYSYRDFKIDKDEKYAAVKGFAKIFLPPALSLLTGYIVLQCR